jgi:hypothetical protein
MAAAADAHGRESRWPEPGLFRAASAARRPGSVHDRSAPRAGVSDDLRQTAAWDEVEASGGARSEALPLLHRCKGSSDGLTAPIHATRARRRSSPAPAARSSFRARKRASPSSGVRGSPRTQQEGRECGVRVGGRVRRAQLHPLGLGRVEVDRDPHRRRAVALRVKEAHRRLEARHQAHIGVRRRRPEREQRRRVGQRAVSDTSPYPSGSYISVSSPCHSDWCVCMPDPFSSKIGLGMNVAVLPAWRATTC